MRSTSRHSSTQREPYQLAPSFLSWHRSSLPPWAILSKIIDAWTRQIRAHGDLLIGGPAPPALECLARLGFA